tara:strand:- start:462 stop:1427 length:966 start_codon:yes stop_codon:yes gene_type:complete
MTTQRKNINKEQFFTQHETAQRLGKFLRKQPWFSDITKVVEPSAGDGAWLKAMQVDEAYDIEPKHPDVKLQDFLSSDFSVINNGKVLYVGNPPFGRMGKLAKQFINKCAETGDYIAFILPASFGKVSMIRQIPENMHLIYQEDLLEETFRFERDGKKVSTVFQVWEKRDYVRIDPVKSNVCADFEFVREAEYTSAMAAKDILQNFEGLSDEDYKTYKKIIETNIKDNFSQRPADCPHDADIAICTHGSGVGKVHGSGFQNKSTRTHRHIKIKSKITKKELVERLRQLDYDSIVKYTVGATCISTEEIVYLYNKKHGGKNVR